MKRIVGTVVRAYAISALLVAGQPLTASAASEDLLVGRLLGSWNYSSKETNFEWVFSSKELGKYGFDDAECTIREYTLAASSASGTIREGYCILVAGETPMLVTGEVVGGKFGESVSVNVLEFDEDQSVGLRKHNEEQRTLTLRRGVATSPPPPPPRIVEGRAYVLVFKHPKSKRHVAWKAIVDRYSGAENARVQVYRVGRSFAGDCDVDYDRDDWISISNLLTCEEAKESLTREGDLGYQWHCLCD